MFKINDTKTDVKVLLGGFKAKDLNVKIQECQDGSCSCECDPIMIQGFLL